MSRLGYQLAVRAPDLTTVAVLPYLSLTWVMRAGSFREPGTFEVTVDPTVPAAKYLQRGYGLKLLRRDQDLDSDPVDSGDLWAFTRGRDADGRRYLTVTGENDCRVFKRRVAYPRPDTYFQADHPAVDPALNTPTVFTGQTETVLKALVNHNAGPAALPERQWRGLVIQQPDRGLGQAATVHGDYAKTLADLLYYTASPSGITYRAVQRGQTVEFQVYAPRDLSATAVFSVERHNLGPWEIQVIGPEATTFLGAGDAGSDTPQHGVKLHSEWTVQSSLAEWGYRSEEYLDNLGQGNQPQLDAATGDSSVDKGPQIGLTMETRDTTDLAYGTHYFLDDIVTVVEDDETVTQRIKQVTITEDQNGPVVTPLVGNPAATLTTPSVRRIRDLLRRMTAVEQRG